MQLEKKNGKYILEKKEGYLDTFTWRFIEELDKINIPYVLISGYVAIVFGRNRSSEDIDILIPKIKKEEFNKLWEQLQKKYYCLNTNNKEEAQNEYLSENLAIRFAIKKTSIPNMEIKYPKTNIEEWVLKNKQEIIVNKHKLYISPIELQIAYKLYLGSEKDLEDAAFLNELFKENINKEELHYFIKELKVQEKYEEHLK